MARARGADFASAYRVDLTDGRRLFAKTHPSPPAGFFTTEAFGLEWLREAHAVAIPDVVAVSDGSADSPALPSKPCGTLMDSAAHGGHREFDLAMMRLFGGFGATTSRRQAGPSSATDRPFDDPE